MSSRVVELMSKQRRRLAELLGSVDQVLPGGEEESVAVRLEGGELGQEKVGLLVLDCRLGLPRLDLVEELAVFGSLSLRWANGRRGVLDIRDDVEVLYTV